MENSLLQGERIVVDKWSYGLRLPLMCIFNYHRFNDTPVEKRDIIVFNNPSEISQRVIDQREVFISRCVGVPGDTLLVDSLFCLIPSEKNSPDQKSLYAYPRNKEKEMQSLLTTLSIRGNELMGQDSTRNVRSFSRYEHYLIEQAITDCWVELLCEEDSTNKHLRLVVPGKGVVIPVQRWNRTLLRNTMMLHENKQAEIKNDTLYIDGRPATHCCFSKDYYWVASNNSTNISDSRLFGFVPKDHIIGKAAYIWFSKQNNTGWFKGFRKERFFTPVR